MFISNEPCKVCGNAEGNETFVAREMMFGFRDEFEYLKCSQCGCLQIKEIPSDIARYYPDNYYSYANNGELQIIEMASSKRIKRAFKKIFLNSTLQNRNFIGRYFSGKLHAYYPWLKTKNLDSKSKILDVGCGSGELLLKMYNEGFRNLTGVDPFIKEDIFYKCGITIYKKQLSEVTEKYDLVMLHHAFEHMNKPGEILATINGILNPGGAVVIRIPIVDSMAWEKYGVNWVQLDAPRHFFLHTNKSIQILSRQTGFELADVIYDSWELQFFGSEKYLKDIPLVDKKEIFSQTEMEQFKNEAQRQNQAKQGDQACFYLIKLN
jgi:SAM-dependent methyltransferase